MSDSIHRPTNRTILSAIDENNQEYLSKYRDIIGIYYRLGDINAVDQHHHCGQPNEYSTKIDDMAYKIIYEKNLISPESIVDSSPINEVSPNTIIDYNECNEYCDWNECTTIVKLFKYATQKRQWEACKFMINEGIIDPNYVFIDDKNLKRILYTFTYKGVSELDIEREMFVLEHTNKELIKTI